MTVELFRAPRTGILLGARAESSVSGGFWRAVNCLLMSPRLATRVYLPRRRFTLLSRPSRSSNSSLLQTLNSAMSEAAKQKDAATRAADALQEKWSIGTHPRFCDDAADFDAAETEEIAGVIRRCYEESVASERVTDTDRLNWLLKNIPGGAAADVVLLSSPPCSASEQWNRTGWQDKERFLIRNGFKTGWSSHTWKHLDRPIQAAWEMRRPDSRRSRP